VVVGATVVVVVAGLIVVVVAPTVVVVVGLVVVVGATVVVEGIDVVGAAVVVVGSAGVVVPAAATESVRAESFQWRSCDQSGRKTPIFTLWVLIGSLAGTTHVVVKVRAWPATKDCDAHTVCRARPLDVYISRSTSAVMLADEATLTVSVTVSPRRTTAGPGVAVVVHPFDVAAVALARGITTAVSAAPTIVMSANRPNHRLPGDAC
jgi:hypothetical protein